MDGVAILHGLAHLRPGVEIAGAEIRRAERMGLGGDGGDHAHRPPDHEGRRGLFAARGAALMVAGRPDVVL